VTPGEGPL